MLVSPTRFSVEEVMEIEMKVAAETLLLVATLASGEVKQRRERS